MAAFALPVVACLVFFIGCFGNGTLIFLIAKHKQLKTMRNAFLLNIAIADILLALCAPVQGVTAGYQGAWVFGLGMCKVDKFLYTVHQAVVIFTLTFLSVERCVEFFNPSCGLDRMRRGVAAVVLVLLWVISSILGLPDMIFADLKPTLNTTYVCFIDSPSNLRYRYQALNTGLGFSILWAIPTLIIAVSFSVMFLTRKRWHRPVGGTETRPTSPNEGQHMRSDEQPHGTNTHASSASHQKSHFTKLVLVLVLVYVIGWLPIHIFRMWFFFGRSGYNNIWDAFMVLGDCMSLAACCVRPWVVFGLDPTFKHFFKKHLCCCFSRPDGEEIFPLDDQTALPAKGSFNYA